MQENQFNISKATHPIVCLVHIGLKFAAAFAYMFLKLITSSSVNTFITVIILVSVDFWFVKNVSGRYLVKMRWWNGEEETGREGWYFESFLHDKASSDIDRHIFWWAQCISTGFWTVMFVVKLLSLSVFWGMLVFICFSLNATNLYGYYLCHGDNQKQVKRMLDTINQSVQTARQSLKLITS